MWAWILSIVKSVYVFIIALFFKIDKANKIFSIMERILTITGFITLLFLIIIPIYHYSHPPITLTFHPNSTLMENCVEYPYVEVVNQYKDLREVTGGIFVNCSGGYYNHFNLKFQNYHETLLKGGQNLFISRDEDFLELINFNKDGECFQAALYYGEYTNASDESTHDAIYHFKDAKIFKFRLEKNGTIKEIEIDEYGSSSPIVNFCTICRVEVTLNAANLKKSIVQNQSYEYSTSQTGYIFPQTIISDQHLTNMYSTYINVPVSFAPCANPQDSCGKILCNEAKKKFPELAMDCSGGSIYRERFVYQ